MQDQRAELTWREDVIPVSTRFDDPYFSLENGLAETRHVFLGGNDLLARFRDGFHVAELGFGTGLNFLATVQAWRGAGTSGRLSFTSFEAYPMQATEMTRALGAFPDLAELADALTHHAPQIAAGSPVEPFEGVTLTVVPGDARATLPGRALAADAWFLDGFSPAKNPELWDADLMRAVFDTTAPGGTAASYTAAGFVRRGLEAAGFTVTRAPGFGRKRHMTRAIRP